MRALDVSSNPNQEATSEPTEQRNTDGAENETTGPFPVEMTSVEVVNGVRIEVALDEILQTVSSVFSSDPCDVLMVTEPRPPLSRSRHHDPRQVIKSAGDCAAAIKGSRNVGFAHLMPASSRARKSLQTLPMKEALFTQAMAPQSPPRGERLFSQAIAPQISSSGETLALQTVA